MLQERYQLAGLALEEVIGNLNIEDLRRARAVTNEATEELPVNSKSELPPTGAYEYYEFNNEKYRLLSFSENNLDGRLFFIPYYEYDSGQYKHDAYQFIFRTHKKFEKALKLLSNEDYNYQSMFNQLLGNKPKSSAELIAKLQKLELKEPDQDDGKNSWVMFMHHLIKVEQISLQMVEAFDSKIRSLVSPEDSTQEPLTYAQARQKCANSDLPKELGNAHNESSLQLMMLPATLPIPKIKGIEEKDVRIVLKEIASEAFKAAVPKSRESMFLLNRGTKIAGIAECLKLLGDKAAKEFPDIKQEIDSFFTSARRLSTLRRREKDVRLDAKESYLSAENAFHEAFNNLPEEARNSLLARIVNPKNALGASLQLRYPLIDSIKGLAENLQGYCNVNRDYSAEQQR